MATVQPYPRNSKGFLDQNKLVPHTLRIAKDKLRQIIIEAISYANIKSSRAILQINNGITDEEMKAIYKKAGGDLYDYFLRYCGDPAATAFACYNRHYENVAKEQFHNRTLQKERMNSGWRYQFIAKDAAVASRRFKCVSDIGATEADFNVTVDYIQKEDGHLNIYVSVKNRTNTMGGQDWPKAIAALESVAIDDRNRTGSYLCVFGMAMERGQRTIKRRGRTKNAHSPNTEIWKSDFFWPFFTNFTYEEIIQTVLDILIETEEPEHLEATIPEALFAEFGDRCKKDGLIDDNGYFCDPRRLASRICGAMK